MSDIDRILVENASVHEYPGDRRMDSFIDIPNIETESRPTQPDHSNGQDHQDQTAGYQGGFAPIERTRVERDG